MTEMESILLYVCFGMLLGRLIGETVGLLTGWIVEHRVKKRDSRQNKGN